MNTGLTTIVPIHILAAQRETFRPSADTNHWEVRQIWFIKYSWLIFDHHHEMMFAWGNIWRQPQNHFTIVGNGGSHLYCLH